MPTIFGSATVCTANRTFTLQNAPFDTSISWTKNGNLTYVSGQGTNNYRVKANSPTTSGSGWVQATITGDCGTTTLPRKNLWVGPKPVIPLLVSPMGGIKFYESRKYLL